MIAGEMFYGESIYCTTEHALPTPTCSNGEPVLDYSLGFVEESSSWIDSLGLYWPDLRGASVTRTEARRMISNSGSSEIRERKIIVHTSPFG